jgi:hypothetical protein
MLYILGWTLRGRATALATAILGPWLNSSTLNEGAPHCRLLLKALSAEGRRGSRHHCPPGVGVVFTIKYLSWAKLYIKHIYIRRSAWVWGGPRSPPVLVQATPGTGGPKSWPTAMSQRRVRRSIHPDVVAMAARRIVAASEGGGRAVTSFFICRGHLNCSSLTERFLNYTSSYCLSWR